MKQNVKKKETYIPSSNGRDKLHVIVWIPQGEIKAVLQISHGMIEDMERYDHFARFMAARGILVCGNDHLGHGLTARNKSEMGYMYAYDASKTMAADVHRVTRCIKRAYPDLPYFLMGHSMGSFIARRYMCEYAKDSKYPAKLQKNASIDGFICMGTGGHPKCMLKIGEAVAGVESMLRGEKHRSKLLQVLAFGTYLFGIPRMTIMNGEKRKRTVKDWLSRDYVQVDKYMADPMYDYTFTVKGYKTLFKTLEFIQDEDNLANVPKNMPVLFISGSKDPVGHYGLDVKLLYNKYSRYITDDVKCILYKDARHEVINEINNIQAYYDIYNWIDLHTIGV